MAHRFGSPGATGSRARRSLRVAVPALAAALGLLGPIAGCSVADPAPRAQPVRTMTVTDDPIASRAEVTFVAQCDVDSRLRRPVTFILACGDGNELLERLSWRAWGESKASACGDLVVSDCTPTCADGKDVRYPVRVVADQLVEGEAAATYRRLSVTGDSGAPGEEIQQVYHLPGIERGEADAAGPDPGGPEAGQEVSPESSPESSPTGTG